MLVLLDCEQMLAWIDLPHQHLHALTQLFCPNANKLSKRLNAIRRIVGRLIHAS